MERIVINGQAVDVPAEVEAKGREAIAAWHKAQLAGAARPAPRSPTPESEEK